MNDSTTSTTNGYNNDYHETSISWDNSGSNIDADPRFIGGGNYHLRSTSPCIDKGLKQCAWYSLHGYRW